MITTQKIIHSTLNLYAKKAEIEFIQAAENCRDSQARKLEMILKNTRGIPWSQQWDIQSSSLFLRKMPITTYANYESFFDPSRKPKEVTRFEPTSGSTHHRKWIPYTPEFLREINTAAHVWMADLYSQFPKIRTGRHYWSLSWLPNELRPFTLTDDSALFPWWQRSLMSKIFLVPSGIAHVRTEEAWKFATSVYLASAKDLSLISVWSPTLLTMLMDCIDLHHDEIEKSLHQGRWSLYAQELERIPCPKSSALSGKIFSNLQLVSCWTSSSSQGFAEDLRRRLPQAAFQGKGLWTTEGVVTFPFQNQYPLAITSHFYEFQDIQTGNILQAHEVKEGQKAKPLLTTSSGLYRYLLEDEVIVTGFYGTVPCFEFLGRMGTIDLVGEKISREAIREILTDLRKEFKDTEFISVLAIKSPEPHYTLLTVGPEEIQSLAAKLEEKLCLYHHYKVARELGQLKMANVLSLRQKADALAYLPQNQVEGQRKIEELMLVELNYKACLNKQ